MKNSNGGDTNVGSISIEEAVKTMEHWVEYEKANKDKINKADELILIQETILADYKRLKEDFKDIDHECFRLEKKEIELEKENAKLKELMKYKIVYTKELEKDLFENASNYVIPKETIKDKLEKLKIECDKMRPYRDVSPHDFGYINGKIDMLAGLLRDDGE